MKHLTEEERKILEVATVPVVELLNTINSLRAEIIDLKITAWPNTHVKKERDELAKENENLKSENNRLVYEKDKSTHDHCRKIEQLRAENERLTKMFQISTVDAVVEVDQLRKENEWLRQQYIELTEQAMTNAMKVAEFESGAVLNKLHAENERLENLLHAVFGFRHDNVL